MKTFCKYLLSFSLGAALSAFIISSFIPATVIRERDFLGSADLQWSVDSFEMINAELPQLVDNCDLTFAVVPTSSGKGYGVIGFDKRIIARFRPTNWDISLARIDARMLALLKQEEERVAAPNP